LILKNVAISLFVILGILCTSCAKDKGNTSAAPVMELEDVERVMDSSSTYDSLIRFHFVYSDINGDFGLSESDTNGHFAFGEDFFYNLFAYMESYENDSWKSVPNPFNNAVDIHFHERIPPLVALGEHNEVTGKIELMIPARPLDVRLDTVRFKFQMIDRALNKSSIIKTKEFRFKHP